MVQFWNTKDSGSGVGCWRRAQTRDLRRIGERKEERSEEWCQEAKGERDSRRKEWLVMWKAVWRNKTGHFIW